MLKLSSIIRRALFTLLLSLQLSAFSQSNYNFTPSVGTYTSITGTDVTSTLSNFTPINIGFTFKFDGINYTQVVPSQWGWLSFNTAITTTMGNRASNGNLTNTDCRPLIGILFTNNSTNGGSRARYTVTGTAPNRVFIFEWYNWQWHWYTTNVISCEIKLYETSNKIECIYNPVSTSSTFYCCTSIGLAFAKPGDYLSLSDFSTSAMASSTSESHNFETQPVSGLTYTFSPLAAKTAPTNQCSNLSASIENDNITLNWTDAPGSVLPDGYLIMASKTNSFTDPIDGASIIQDNDLTDGTGIVKALPGQQSYYGWNKAESSTNYYFKIFSFTNGGSLTKYNKISAPTAQIKHLKSTPTVHATSLKVKNNAGNYEENWVDASKFGQSIHLSGRNSDFETYGPYLFCPNTTALNITGNAITLEAWINPEQTIGDIFQKTNGALTNGYRLYISTNGQICFGLYSGTWNEVKSSENSLPINAWSYVCATYDGATQKIYLNGKLLASKSTTGNIAASTEGLSIGTSPSSSKNFFTGKIDEISIWSKTRSESEILSDMALNISGSEPGLVAYFKCNDNTSDSSPNAVVSYLTNSGSSFQSSNANQNPDGYVLQTSITNTFSNVVNGTEFTTDNDLTDGSGTVNVTSGIQTFGGWTNINASKPYNFRIIPFSNKSSERVYNTNETIPLVSINPQPTNHATAFTASSANGNIVLNWTDAIGTQLPDGYVILASTSPTITAPASGTEITIDNNLSDGSGAVKVLRGVQTYSNWTNIVANTPYYFNIYPYTNNNEAINYKTDGTVPQTNGSIVIYQEPTYHASGFSATNNGTLTLNWSDAKGINSLSTNNALAFDGTSDYVSSDAQNPAIFTIEAWINSSLVGADGAIVSTLNESTPAGMELHIGSNGKASITIKNASGWIDVNSPDVIPTNTWVHLAASYNGTTIKLYINGTLVNQQSNSSFNQGANLLNIGKRSVTAGGYFFKGIIDEVRVWNVARTESEIQSNYQNELTGTETGLVSYYSFNQGVANGTNTGLTTLTDKKALHPGTLQTFTLSGTNSNWVNSVQAPQYYLIKASATNSFSDPVDGTEIAIDNNLSDGVAVVKVAQGTQSYSNFVGTTGSNTYYIKMWPYTNEGSNINYKTAATVPTASIVFNKTKPITHVTNLTTSNNNKVITMSWNDATEGTPSFSNAISLDGTNDFISIPALGSNLEQLTIETWLNYSATSSGAGLFNTNSWVNKDIHLQIWNNSSIEFAPAGANPATYSAPYTFSVNTWYHVAVTYNYTSKQVKFYVNGTLIQTSTFTSAVLANLTAAQIGAWTSQRYFPGKLDEYRIWNTERTQSDIFNNMFSELTGSELGLIAYYKFNQGSASENNAGLVTVIDASPNAKNGTLTNFALSGTSSNWVSTGDIGRKITSPDGYLIKASKTDNITSPVNGNVVPDDNNLDDGVGAINITAGVQTYNGWVNFTDTTAYYFKVYPYSNTGTSRIYNTIAPVPSVKDSVGIEPFKEIATSIPNICEGSTAWANFDSDEDMDFIISGGQSIDGSGNATPSPSFLYQQNATFSNTSTLTGALNGDINWVDYDNDGDLDAFITGYNGSSRVANMYRQEADHSFTELSSLFPKKFRYSSSAWADYDNDGDLDVFITGQENTSSRYAALYRNNGNGTFTELTESLFTNVNHSSVAWGDYNNDGKIDLLITGDSDSGKISKVYQNNGDGYFSELTTANLTGISYGKAVWLDYNNDGYLDILLSGNTNGSIPNSWDPFSCLYKNDGNGKFIQQSFSNLPALWSSSITYGDYNNDGLIDFVMTGNSSNGGNVYETAFFEQNSDHTFTRKNDFNLANLSNGSANLVDYNNDGNLDLFLSGKTGLTVVKTILYKNTNLKKNSAPSKPTGLKYAAGQQYTLSWKPSTDVETPTAALTYNLRVGTTKNGSEVVSPMSLPNGYKQTPTMGNCQFNTYTALNLKVGRKYYWSVQAVDNGYKGSAFSAIDSVVVDTIPTSKLSLKILSKTSVKANWTRGNGTRCAVFVKMKFDIATLETSYPVNGVQYIGVSKFKSGPSIGSSGWYCVYNGIEDSVIITDLTPESLYAIHVVEYLDNSGSPEYYRMNSLSKDNYAIFNTNQYLTNQTGYAETSLADFNKDGYIDILDVTGNVATIKLNNGNNSFTSKAAFTITIPNKYLYIERLHLNIADYNNDGFIDAIVAGSFNNENYNGNKIDSTFTKLFTNKGDNTFIEETGVEVPGVIYGSLVFGDYDNDGDVDLLICGEYNYYQGSSVNWVQDRITQLYINSSTTTNTQFTRSTNTDFFGIEEGNAVWVDFNNDGYIDIAYSGSIPNNDPSNGGGTGHKIAVFKLYINNRNGTFSEVITNMNGGYIDYGGNTVFCNDYDNDGDLDIKVEGTTSSSGGVNNFRILINNFPKSSFTLSNSLVDFYKYNNKVDYDNDGDLDNITGRIERNNYNYYPGDFASNQQPAKPTNLKYANVPGYVQLMWDEMTSDKTPSAQMSYNIRLRQEGSSQWLGAPQSMDNGTRLTPNFGNIPFKPNGFNTFAKYNLPEGKYEWQVQAIDGSFSGSEWSDISSFTVKAALASFTADSVCLGDTTLFIDNSFSYIGIKEWRWDFGDIPTVTGKVQKHVFQTIGDHFVRLIITNNSLQNDTVYGNAYVKPIPSVSFTADDVCEGLTATIVNPANTDGLIDWIWDFGDGSTSNYFNPGTHTYGEKKNYTIKFTVTAENNCSSTATKTIAIKDRPSKPTISESVNNFCPGTEVKLEVTSSTNGLNFQWKRNGDIIDGANSNTYSGKLTAADYSVVVEPGSCSSESNKLTIVTKPAPPKPTILGHGPTIWTLACDNMTATSYKWYYNNSLIPGTNGYQYYANKNYGDYYVSVNDGGECWTPSDIFKVGLPNGIDDLSYENVKVFPNPSQGVFNVSLGEDISGEVNIHIVDVLGKVVLSQVYNTSDFPVDISQVTKGIYYISITYKNEVIIKKVVKQ